MAKTANISAKVEPEIKQRAEQILNRLGIPMSNAIDMFLNQIILQNGIPFELKIPRSSMLSLDKLSEDELNRELEKGYNCIKEGRMISADDVDRILKERYGI